jgi:hypothetical protein
MKPDKMHFQMLGPPLGRFEMPKKLMTELVTDSHAADEDYSENLVGIIDKQLVMNFSPEAKEYFIHCAKTFIETVFSDKHENVRIGTGWHNIMTQNWEHNPVHWHGGCLLSSVGFLEIPTSDNIGPIEFHLGGGYPTAPIKFDPVVGNFMIWLWYTQHMVSPIRNIKGTRRSFSINFTGRKVGSVEGDGH